jgi:hypothetical protein
VILCKFADGDYNRTARHYIPEFSTPSIHHSENLKSQMFPDIHGTVLTSSSAPHESNPCCYSHGVISNMMFSVLILIQPVIPQKLHKNKPVQYPTNFSQFILEIRSSFSTHYFIENGNVWGNICTGPRFLISALVGGE